MKKAIYICLFLAGCAIVPSQNEFYHRFAMKPSVTEKDLGNGNKRETVNNPYEVPIIVTVDCDNEQLQRKIHVNSNAVASFYTASDIDYNCSIFQWVVE